MIKMSPLVKYLYYSIIVTIIDASVVWILFHIMQIKLIEANTIGILIGFIVHYILSSKSIFETRYGLEGFIIYFGTFLMGLILANFLIFYGEYYLFSNIRKEISFLLSKGISIVIPFFLQYYVRKILFNRLKLRMMSNEESIT